jgi:outer membrane protein TolC
LLDAQNSKLQVNQVEANALYDFFLDCISLEKAVGTIDLLMSQQEGEEMLQRLIAFINRTGRR